MYWSAVICNLLFIIVDFAAVYGSLIANYKHLMLIATLLLVQAGF